MDAPFASPRFSAARLSTEAIIGAGSTALAATVARCLARNRSRYDATGHAGSSHARAKSSRNKGSSAALARCLLAAETRTMSRGSRCAYTFASVAPSSASTLVVAGGDDDIVPPGPTAASTEVLFVLDQ